MKIDEVYPSRWLKSSDLQNRQVTVIIEKIVMEELGDEGNVETKPVIYFKGKDKGLVCNRTNWGSIAAIYGDESDDWIGKQIVLFSMKVQFKKQITDAIRIMPPQTPMQPQQTARPPVAMPRATQQAALRDLAQNPPQEEEGDQIPF